jgi:NAD(P)-dependent dehydrogenase (short-subunit alcohol dehydrogenase family)
MLATELALKGIPVRVNSIAPGVYASEMTSDSITKPEEVAKIAESLIPVPAGRGGTYVQLRRLDFRCHLTHSLQAWRNGRYSDLSIVASRVLYQWAGDCGRWKLYCRQPFYSLMSDFKGMRLI